MLIKDRLLQEGKLKSNVESVRCRHCHSVGLIDPDTFEFEFPLIHDFDCVTLKMNLMWNNMNREEKLDYLNDICETNPLFQ